MPAYIPYNTPSGWKTYYADSIGGIISNDQQVRIDILGMLETISNNSQANLTALLQNGSGVPSVFKIPGDDASVFIDQDTEDSYFATIDNKMKGNDLLSVFKGKLDAKSVFKPKEVVHGTLASPANAAAVQTAINADLATIAASADTAVNIQSGYYVVGATVTAWWTISIIN